MIGRRLAVAALWSLFAVLVLAGGWLFLRACALDALGLDYCPSRQETRALRRAAAEGDTLARELHMAELSVAEAPVCSPEPAAPRPKPATLPALPSAPPTTETKRIDRKVEERGGRNGRLQFTLEWATFDDLDLNVVCPGGAIDATPGHAGPGICGDGRKDVDANRNLVENLSSTPIENIAWRSDIPSGVYQVEIIEYKANSNDGDTVPFTLRMRWNDQERVCRDAVTSLPLTPQRVVNGRVIGGTEKMLTWTFGEALPDCTFETSETIRGGATK